MTSEWPDKLARCTTPQEVQALVAGRTYARELNAEIPALTDEEAQQARYRWAELAKATSGRPKKRRRA